MNHCIDHAILDAVGRWKVTTVRQVRGVVDYPDYRLRSRVQKLVEEGKLAKGPEGLSALSLRGHPLGLPEACSDKKTTP